MTEKPLVIMLQANSKIGKQVLNFDKYIVNLKYRINSTGITIEVFPPQKKKPCNYNQFVSPYEVGLRCNVCSCPVRKVKPKGGAVPRLAKVEPAGGSRKINECLKKLSVQRVFNFSETPFDLLGSFQRKPVVKLFSKSKDFPAASKENVFKYVNRTKRKDLLVETTGIDPLSRKVSPDECRLKTKKPIQKSKSGTVSDARTRLKDGKSLRLCKSSGCFLLNKVEKLQRQNLSLRRKLQLILRR